MDIQPQLEKLKLRLEREDFKGCDPYDALNSPILTTLAIGKKWPRIAFIQALKKLPFNLRPLLGVRKGHNPKGIGLFLWGYAKLYKATSDPSHLRAIDHLLDLLEELKSTGYSGNCWGYNFDWQSRAFFVPKYTPTIVNSAFIGHALLDTYLHTGNRRALDFALPIKDFILNNLYRTEENGAFCFSYTPLDKTIVHNANLLGASLLIRLSRYVPDENLKEVALKSLAYSMRHQRTDGSWFYADTSIQGWIDSFHTGFNLQSIRYFLDEGYAGEYREAYEKGVRFYAENFFLPDGTPKYYHNKVYPIDIHSPAQAIVFFSGMGEKYKGLTERVLAWTMDNMCDSKGYFYFQKFPRFTNKIPYMRWGQAWAFHALTEHLLRSTIMEQSK
ncbi:MAG: delta-aminolevulinic acid dehydratase [Deltaproteobacteria bacterium]|nr:delta-aminolevulinic acid dehydratase [Deltaproteobacteria bacterium]